jgi:hypothetical protein
MAPTAAGCRPTLLSSRPAQLRRARRRLVLRRADGRLETRRAPARPRCSTNDCTTVAPNNHAAMGPGPGAGGAPGQPGLPPVGPDEQRLSAATGRVSHDAWNAIGRLAQIDPAGRGEAELIAHIQDIFRAFRALLSDLKMAVDEQET